MTISHRENKKDKGVAFKSIYEDETMGDQVDNETHMNESIALLTKQFSKVVTKFQKSELYKIQCSKSNQLLKKRW